MGNGQNRDTLLGKILRLDPTATDDVPRRQPVRLGRRTARDLDDGLRNPWRISFDADDRRPLDRRRRPGPLGGGRLAPEGAAGSGRGANLGWDLFEGDEQFSSPNPAAGAASAGPFTPPVFTYSHDGDEGGCSITGGYVYRGTEIAGPRRCLPVRRLLPRRCPRHPTRRGIDGSDDGQGGRVP